MPGDSSYYFIGKKGDTLFLPDSLAKRAEQEVAVDDYSSLSDKSSDGADTGMWITLAIFAIIFGGRYAYRLIRQQYQVKLVKGAYETNFQWYHQQLTTYNQYYRSLPRGLQEKFVQRTVEFMFSKKFHYVGLQPISQMPLLVSAAAIQITFGLEKYLYDHFRDIFLYKSDYRYGTYNQPFMGHVSVDGIHLSWNNFLKGYENYNDADNVGIHEMAHALAYVNFIADQNNGTDTVFKEGFIHFSAVARPIFNSMQNGNTNFLSNYAATNYHEFWAVAVETFFEKSNDLKQQMPDLYDALCKLLNQDPLLREKMLKPLNT